MGSGYLATATHMEKWLLPIAIVLAAVITAMAFRYVPGPASGNLVPIIDRWTGCVYSGVRLVAATQLHRPLSCPNSPLRRD